MCTDDGRELTVPVLLDGEESIMEFIDLPYSGVRIYLSIYAMSWQKRIWVHFYPHMTIGMLEIIVYCFCR